MTLNFLLIIIGIPIFLVTVYLTRRFWTAAAYRSRLEYLKTYERFTHKAEPVEPKGE
jgi:hypothetical protein